MHSPLSEGAQSFNTDEPEALHVGGLRVLVVDVLFIDRDSFVYIEKICSFLRKLVLFKRSFITIERIHLPLHLIIYI